jgi:hypothetical protein
MNIVKDPIDELLKADLAVHREAYIDDAGFTLRVIDALPHRSPVSPAMRLAIPGGFALLAAIFVALFAGGGNFVVDAVMDIATSSMTQSALAFVTVVVLMILVSIGAASDN